MVAELYGPRTAFGQAIHLAKYRHRGESFDDYCVRYSRAVTGDNPDEFRRMLRHVRSQAWLPAGRSQLAVGRPFQTTAYNCYVGGTIGDSLWEIFGALQEGMETLRAGGGCGWDFSTLRPEGEPIRGLGEGAFASGPVSFMSSWNTGCSTILSAGHRRGAMMGVLRVDHPDILKFISAKREPGVLTNFNISVAATDEFMEALANDGLYWLKFGGRNFTQVRALDVWAKIMENNWDWAEPGVLFMDRINARNPLYYCEQITATNPCGEQPLPPYGACLLGSPNLLKTLRPMHLPANVRSLTSAGAEKVRYEIDFELLNDIVDAAVRANDAIIDITKYPLEAQKIEAQSKRRMGIGATGFANTLEILGFAYGSKEYIEMKKKIGMAITVQAYRTSIELAKEKGPFELFDAEKYCKGWFVQNVLPSDIREQIARYGIRNALLTSQAPCGTISMVADNVSSGIEPPYALETKMLIHMPGSGPTEMIAKDHAYEFYGVSGKTSDQVTAEEHIDVLCAAQSFTDSAVSKTCNVSGQIAGEGPGMSFDDFKKLYIRAWEGGAKGCTTFNKNGKRMGVREALSPEPAVQNFVQEEGLACTYDPVLGIRSCEEAADMIRSA